MYNVFCPYCKRQAILTRLKLGGYYRYYWVCDPCDAKIEANVHSKKPLGVMANRELRFKRMEAHRFFDVSWLFTADRSAQYAKLAKHLDLPLDKCHIRKFDMAMCNRVIQYSRG